MTNLEQFISQYVTESDSSLFARDIQNWFSDRKDILLKELEGIDTKKLSDGDIKLY